MATISTAMVTSEKRLPNRRKESVLLLIDCIVRADREAAQCSSDLARLASVRRPAPAFAIAPMKSVMVYADLSSEANEPRSIFEFESGSDRASCSAISRQPSPLI